MFGGRQKILRDMAIKQENGYLGPFKLTLKVGDVQTMFFQSTDKGPFWMTPEEKEQNQKDIIIHTKTKVQKYTKDELRGFLEAKGVFMKGNLSALQSTCQQKGDSNRREKNKVIEGWEGKAKGGEKKAYQNYSIKGYNDQFGNHRSETSLKEFMSSCKDFIEEETMLQSIACDLGVCVNRTPKCHCKLAGEGIEYAWACSKKKDRSILLENKRGKENFVSRVRSCISREHITRERAQKFAKRARRYIMGYHVLHQQQSNENSSGDNSSMGSKNEAIMPVKLEQMVKNFETHRCALDFDYSFCKEVFKEER